MFIKINLPKNIKSFIAGNGEGVWVEIDEATAKDYKADATGGEYIGILQNDSLYYSELKAGSEITFEMRGNDRPVAHITESMR